MSKKKLPSLRNCMDVTVGGHINIDHQEITHFQPSLSTVSSVCLTDQLKVQKFSMSERPCRGNGPAYPIPSPPLAPLWALGLPCWFMSYQLLVSKKPIKKP